MKKFTIGVLLFTMLGSAAAVQAQSLSADSVPTLQSLPDSTLLTISRAECVRIALETNPTIKVADMELQRMDYTKKETLAALFPTIDFSLSYQRSIELQTVKMNMGGQSQAFKMGSDNAWNMGFNVAVPVVAPALWKSLDLADTQILKTVEAARASRLDMVNNVNKAYYTLMYAIAAKKVLLDNYENTRFNAELYEKKFKVGTASEYDVLRSSVQVKNLEPELLQADIAIRQAELQLKMLMGMDAAVSIRPDTDLDTLRTEMASYVSLMNSDISDNTTLRTLDLDTRLADQNIEMKKRAFIPTVAATFNLAWSSLSSGNMFKNIDLNPYSTVGFAVSVPIFSGGSRYYGLKGAQVQRAELTLQRENLVRNLNMQVELAKDNINKEVRQIATNAEGVRQAVKAHEIMQKSFEIGAASFLDLRDSELAETTARLAYYQAIYNYLVSTSELDLLLGRNNTK